MENGYQFVGSHPLLDECHNLFNSLVGIRLIGREEGREEGGRRDGGGR